MLKALRIYPEIFVNMDNYMHDTSEEDISDTEANNHIKDTNKDLIGEKK